MISAEIIYFCHGIPGSEHDASLLDVSENTHIIAPNLLDAAFGDILTQFDHLTTNFSENKFHIVGFSIGAMVATQIAAARPDNVNRLTLISSAAPLELGDFLPHMAGKMVFQLARNSGPAFKALTTAQRLMLWVAPNFLINQLFAKCGAPEKALLSDSKFRAVLLNGLKNSLHEHPDSYMHIVQSYVNNSASDLEHIKCPVEIWHGERDTWAPVTMAHALFNVIKPEPKLHIVEDAEHYSTLTKTVLSHV